MNDINLFRSMGDIGDLSGVSESIYRSPKFLRKFVDFEINTGRDIKGEPSEKEKKRRILEEWDKKWQGCSTEELRNFYEDVYLKAFTTQIKPKYMGDMTFWEKFDKWKKEKEDKAKKQKLIERELEDLYLKLQKDSRSYPYQDKFDTKNNGKQFEYKFEDGCTFVFNLMESSTSIIYTDTTHVRTYTIGLTYRLKFITLCNFIVNNSRMRPSQGYSHAGATGSSDYRYREREKTRNTSGDPKRDKYNSLKETVRLRREQLSKMNKLDVDYQVLKNELEAAENALNALKNKYKFENLSSFSDFNN